MEKQGKLFSEILKAERDLRGWSQQRLADELDTTREVVSRWEGNKTFPSPHFREKLITLLGKDARALGLTSQGLGPPDQPERNSEELNEEPATIPEQAGENLSKGNLPSIASRSGLLSDEDVSETQSGSGNHPLTSRRVFLMGGVGAAVLAIGGGIAVFVSHLSHGEVVPPPTLSPFTPYYSTQLLAELGVIDMEFAPDNRSLAMARGNKTAEVFDLSSKASRVVYRQHTGFVNAVTWSPNGSMVATASSDQTAQVWNASPDATQRRIYTGHTGAVTCVAWSPDGTRIASASYDTQVHIWDPLLATPALMIYRGHTAKVWWVAWSPNNRYLASCGDDDIVRVWSASTGQLIYAYGGHHGSVYALKWSYDGTRIASASADATIHIWQALTGKNVVVCTDSMPVHVVCWSPDGRYIVTGSENQMVRVWDTNTGKLFFFYHTDDNIVYAVAYTSDGRHIASGDHEGYLQLWQKT